MSQFQEKKKRYDKITGLHFFLSKATRYGNNKKKKRYKKKTNNSNKNN